VSIAGTPVCREHIALRWGIPSELAQLPLAPSDRKFVEARLTIDGRNLGSVVRR
jgi:hypothetical protein